MLTNKHKFPLKAETKPLLVSMWKLKRMQLSSFPSFSTLQTFPGVMLSCQRLLGSDSPQLHFSHTGTNSPFTPEMKTVTNTHQLTHTVLKHTHTHTHTWMSNTLEIIQQMFISLLKKCSCSNCKLNEKFTKNKFYYFCFSLFLQFSSPKATFTLSSQCRGPAIWASGVILGTASTWCRKNSDECRIFCRTSKTSKHCRRIFSLRQPIRNLALARKILIM